MSRSSKTIFRAAFLLISGLLCSAAIAADGPVIPKAKGEQCVEPVDVMRRDHFEFILHKRDETMHKGIRTSRHSLVECINCHVLPDENQQFVSHEDPAHFCSTCHSFAAVRIDCFECHADKPVEADTATNGEAHSPVKQKDNPAKILDSTLIASSLKELKAKH